MDPIKIIEKHYKKNSKSYNALILHGKQVKRKALHIARKVPRLKPDLIFIAEAAMLHDIGIKFTNANDIGCHGKHRYIEHTYLGGELLRKEGFPKHAKVCERHIGVGITKKEIIKNKLPLPKRNFIPLSVEEQIVCIADKFYTKEPGKERKERSLKNMKKKISAYGRNKPKKWDLWCKRYKLDK